MDLFVSIRCPQCGADISFEEESTVIHCKYCGSALCLTGRSGVTRTYVAPREDVARMKKSLTGVMGDMGKTGEARALISDKTLFFVPYWRVKAMVFRWFFGRDFQGHGFKTLKTKNLDHTFPAYSGINLGLQSLGIRPDALKLRYYNKEDMSSQGTIMKVSVPFKNAVLVSQDMMEIGSDDINGNVFFDRAQMIGERYSVIYFPFWIIRISKGDASRILIMDAVANTVTRNITADGWSDMMAEAEKKSAPVSFSQVAFIPFKCPNCGWDLPLNRFNIIHLCHTCHRAWIERDSRFRAVAFDVVEPPESVTTPLVYLPFWSFSAEASSHGQTVKTVGDLHAFSGMFPTRQSQDTDQDAIRFHIPAAEIRNIPAANKLATEMTQKQPTLRFMPKDRLDECVLMGAYLPPKAARKMSDVLLCSLTPKGNRVRQDFIREAEITAGKMKLLWWPFLEQHLFLRDALCQCGIQKGTVAPAHPVHA